MDVLVGSVEQEDEGNDSVGGVLATGLVVDGSAGSLQAEEDDHANGGSDEQEATTKPLDHEGSSQSPSQVPDLQETVDEELEAGKRCRA